MYESRIAVVEDDAATRDIIRAILLGSRHAIEAEATNREDAIRLAQAIRAGETEIDVMLLDGNLSEGGPRDGSDVRAVVDTLGVFRRHVKLVNISLSPSEELGIRFDADIGKFGLVSKLESVIESF